MITKLTSQDLINFEKNVAAEFKAGKIKCPLHLCGGNEEHLLALFMGIRPVDWVLASHRSHYHYLLKGGNPLALMDELYGLPTGCSKGQGRSMHYGDASINFLSSAILGGMPAIAVGIALAIKKVFGDAKDRPLVWCFVGDGGEDSGHFFEAARFGFCRALPLVFIIEDNDLATATTKQVRWHRFMPIEMSNIIRYEYTTTWPHVGIGENIAL